MSPALDRRSWRVVAAVVLLAAALAGCATVPHSDRMDEAVAVLQEPLPGDLAALYRLRVARTSGLRLAVITSGGAGRWTVSEAFGSAVSLTAWTAAGDAMIYDMDAGCRREIDDLREVLGIDAFPLAQAARLLGGRLPAVPGDTVTISPRGVVEIRGDGWGAKVRVAADPWRVVDVRPIGGGWRIKLDGHTGSVPGHLLVKGGIGRSAELELIRNEWPEHASLPELPEFPFCVER